MRRLLIGVVVVLCSFNVKAISPKLLWILFDKITLKSTLTSFGLEAQAVSELLDQIDLSLKHLVGDWGSREDLVRLLSQVQSDPQVEVKRREVLELLNRSAVELDPVETKTALIELINLSRKIKPYGIYFGCYRCVQQNELLPWRWEQARTPTLLKAWESIPRNPIEIKKFVKVRTSKDIGLKMNLANEDWPMLALLFNLKNYGSRRERELVETIVDLATMPDGKVDFSIGPFFWRLPSMNLSPAQVSQWNFVLKELKAAHEKFPSKSLKEHFDDYLIDHSDKHNALQYIAEKKCFE